MRLAAAGCVAAQAEPVDEVVDERQMVIDFPVAERDPAAARDAPKELQQPAIAGTVDARGPHDRDLDAEARAGVAGQALSLEFRDLIDVAGLERRVFVGGRMLDVAVDADRAAVHDAADAGARGRVDHVRGCGRVDGAVDLVAEAGLPVHRGDVIDDVDAVGRGSQRVAIAQVARHQRDPGLFQRRGCRRLDPHQRGHHVAARREGASQMPSGKARRPGD